MKSCNRFYNTTMSLTNNFGYEYVFKLAKQLTPEERKMLSRELNQTGVKKHEPKPLPVMSDEEIAERKQRLLEKALQCPVLSEEELKKFDEARKEINECRLASK